MTGKYFQVFRAVVVLVLVCANGATSQNGVVCPVNSQILLTGDRSVLDRNTGITSSEENPRNPASEFTVSTLGWCSPDQTANISSLYVEITFIEPIIPVILVSGGKQNAYVQNFTLLYTTDEASNDFEAYGVLKSAQDFYVRDILASDAYFALERPFITRKIRFHVNGGRIDPLGRICWTMMMYGCKASDAQSLETEEVPPAMISTTPTTTVNTHTRPPIALTTDSSTDSSEQLSPANCPQEAGHIAQKDLLLVVIPCVVVLVVAVLIAVTAGVIICMCLNKSPSAESPTYESVKVKMSNKRTKEIVANGTGVQGVYDQPRPQFYDVPKSMHSPSPFRSSTSSLGSNMEIKNPVYLEKKNLQEMSIALQQLPPDEGNDYEDVLEALPARRGQDRHTQANAAYSSSFYRPPLPSASEVPNNDASRPPLAVPSGLSRTMSLDKGIVPKYSKVNKEKKTGADEAHLERGRSTSPVIKSHYMSTNAAITEELNRLTTELENSLRGQS